MNGCYKPCVPVNKMNINKMNENTFILLRTHLGRVTRVARHLFHANIKATFKLANDFVMLFEYHSTRLCRPSMTAEISKRHLRNPARGAIHLQQAQRAEVHRFEMLSVNRADVLSASIETRTAASRRDDTVRADHLSPWIGTQLCEEMPDKMRASVHADNWVARTAPSRRPPAVRISFDAESTCQLASTIDSL